MVTEAAPESAVESGPIPVVDGIEDPFGLLSGNDVEAEEPAPTEQAPDEPDEQPVEDEAELALSTEAEAPSQAEQESHVPRSEDGVRYIEMVAKAVNSGKIGSFYQVPAEWRQWAVDQFEGNAKAAAQEFYDTWRSKASYTEEDVAEREEQVKQQAFEEAQQATQQQVQDQQIWTHFATKDPALNAELAGDNYDLFEAAEQYPEAYERYRQLRYQAQVQSDPEAQFQEAVRKESVAAQRSLLGDLLGAFMTQDFVSSVPTVKSRLDGAKGDGKFLTTLGYEESMPGFVQFFMDTLREAAEHHGTTKAAKKVQEQKGAISEAAARQALAKWRGDNVPKGDGTPGSGASGFTADKLSDPEFWAEMSTKSPEEQARAQQAYDRLNLGTPLRRR